MAITPQEIYDRYIIKTQKNSMTDNLSTDRGRFAELYNESAPRMIKWYINNRNRDDIKDVQVLLVDDKPIVPTRTHLDHTDFEIPEDFLAWSFVRGKATKGECKYQDVNLFEIANEDRDKITSSFYLPSFDYREFPYTYSQNFLKVFNEEGVTFDKIYFSYYKYPAKITLVDDMNPESDFNNVDIQLPEEVINRIISAMAGDFKMNNYDNAWQIDKQRQYENLQ